MPGKTIQLCSSKGCTNGSFVHTNPNIDLSLYQPIASIGSNPHPPTARIDLNPRLPSLSKQESPHPPNCDKIYTRSSDEMRRRMSLVSRYRAWRISLSRGAGAWVQLIQFKTHATASQKNTNRFTGPSARKGEEECEGQTQ
jgi:hypothetical protein